MPLLKSVRLRVGQSTFVFGGSWLVMGALGLGSIGILYIPIMAPFFGPLETWTVTLLITLLAGGSLVVHASAHAVANRLVSSPHTAEPPIEIPLYPFGDAAQVWPAASTPVREIVEALAGPVSNFCLATVAYLIWDLQLHPTLNVSMIFLTVFNVGLAAINFAPGYPLDGGRLTRVILWDLLVWPAASIRLAIWLGRLIILGLVAWGIVLILTRARFSLEIGAGTILFAGLLGLALWRNPSWKWDRSPESSHPLSTTHRGLYRIRLMVRGLVASLLLASLTGVTFSLLPTMNGIHAPGFAIPVEPMVSVAPEYRHPYSGSFILTSVISQTPIIWGQWVYAQLSPAVELVPPERIVPPDITPQELMEQNYELLEQSETKAVVVALRLAGYDVKVFGEAVEVTSILPDSPALGKLQAGDHIVALNGKPIRTVSELIEKIRAQNPDSIVDLTIERSDEQMSLTLPLMKPSNPGEPPRLGIAVRTVGIDAELPFPVKIEPQKIAGGPSAGLMFTLTVYNMITPEDLTRGHQIAGTGTIDLDGKVGPIGGVAQKVVGAERAGAEYFLVPPENYEDAKRVAHKIQVIEVATAQEAIEFLRSLPADDTAQGPG